MPQIQRLRWLANPGPQASFLQSTVREALYGGAAGGGKSDALMMVPLYRVDNPKHRSLMLRRTRPQLQEVIDRTIQIYPEVVPGAQWKEAESRWKWPSGAITQMGYAEHEKDILNFKTFEYDTICFDELTSFSEWMYLFMFLRNRTKSALLPPIMRSGTNPGDIGHEWVFRRFIDKRVPYQVYNEFVEVDSKRIFVPRQFIPSRVWDNPAMPNRDEYIAGIMQLSAEDQAAYLYGEWSRLAGAMFRELFVAPMNDLMDRDYFIVRSIDFGISDPTCVLWLAHYPKSGITDIVSELYMKEATLDGVAKAIKEREVKMALRPPVYSVGSPEMFARQATSNQSIATMLGAQGVYVEKGNTDLVAGWSHIRNLQQRNAIRAWPGQEDGTWGAPNTCRTLPILQRDTGINKDPNKLRPRQQDHCLISNTLILTNYGWRQIKDVQANDIVWTRKGWKKVLWSGQTGVNVPVYRLTTTKGIIVGTPNHPIWVNNKGFLPLDSLRYGDILNGCIPNTLFLTKSFLEGIQNPETTVIECTSGQVELTGRKESETFIKKSGKQLMAQFQQSITFITKTITHSIMRLRTWNVLRGTRIYATMDRTVHGLDQSEILPTWTALDRKQPSGTEVQRDEYGTSNTAKRFGKQDNLSELFVRNVRQNLMTFLTMLNSVRLYVKAPGDEVQELITNNDNVKYVEEYSLLTDTTIANAALASAPVVVKVEPSGTADVYNLTVEDEPEFYANGILVHNCADALRYGLMVVYERPDVVAAVQAKPDDPNKDNVFDKMVADIQKGSKKHAFPELGCWDA